MNFVERLFRNIACFVSSLFIRPCQDFYYIFISVLVLVLISTLSIIATIQLFPFPGADLFIIFAGDHWFASLRFRVLPATAVSRLAQAFKTVRLFRTLACILLK